MPFRVKGRRFVTVRFSILLLLLLLLLFPTFLSVTSITTCFLFSVSSDSTSIFLCCYVARFRGAQLK
ncbi:unnamed protein product [Microthlaspi erraticum]|uniref:Uncharacterized protein n=1 Tax=Microthlaspi erraticum TaxID=1685480 RepID=A0A6D2HZ89_9BRAS|nr:unnamed protein product [Microthlaspi erraticum]